MVTITGSRDVYVCPDARAFAIYSITETIVDHLVFPHNVCLWKRKVNWKVYLHVHLFCHMIALYIFIQFKRFHSSIILIVLGRQRCSHQCHEWTSIWFHDLQVWKKLEFLLLQIIFSNLLFYVFITHCSIEIYRENHLISELRRQCTT